MINVFTICTYFGIGYCVCVCYYVQCCSSLQLVAVHLVDSHYCVDPAKFVSILFTSLSTMVQIELPHMNLLSKVDLMEQYGKLGQL